MSLRPRSGSVNPLDMISTVAIVATCGVIVWFLLYRLPPPPPPPPSITLPAEPVSIEGSAVVGQPNASTVMLIYSDFLCPFCARFALEGLPQLQLSYVATGKVQMVFRHQPLARRHPAAPQAAFAAECAGRQGRFWKAHDALFMNQRALAASATPAFAEAAGLTEDEMRDCVQSAAAIESRISRDAEEAAAMGISSTPFFVFGRREPDARIRLLKAVRARPIPQIAAALDEFIGNGR